MRGRAVLTFALFTLTACSSYNLHVDDGKAYDIADSESADDTTPDPPEAQDTGAEDECDDVAPVSLFISPDDSNSMVSPVLAREAVLEHWNYLNYVPIRSWEFLNYYDFALEPPIEDDIAIHVSAVPDPLGEDGAWLMQIGLASRTMERAERDPVSLTFSLDTSGSMSGQPIELLRQSCLAMASQLREGDVVSIVTWSSSQNTLLSGHQVTGPNDPVLVDAIQRIDDGGSTDLHGGLTAAYNLAKAAYSPDRINRVVLISDGGANVGVTDEDIIAGAAATEDAEGIYMAGIGVGTASSYNEVLMDTVTDLGRGAALFIADEEEAWHMLGDGFLEVVEVAARNVQIRMDLPPGVSMVAFSGEEYSTNRDEIEPQHLAPNDTMIFQEHLHACAPSALDGAEVTVVVEWQDATTYEGRSAELTVPWTELVEGPVDQLWKGEAIYQYALALKSRKGEGKEWQTAEQRWWTAQVQAEAHNPGDPDLSEIRAVMAKF